MVRTALFFGGLFVLTSAFGWGLMPVSAAPQLAPSSAQPLDDPLEPLRVKTPRTEEEEDRLHAAALFAAARTLEQRQDPAGALRRYQRALRYDPGSSAILREIVPLAFSLNRNEEAIRYAVKAVEQTPTDATLLKRLGRFLSEDGQLERALKAYEAALALEGPQRTAEHAALALEMGRLYLLAGNIAQAEQALRKARTALENPLQHGLGPTQHKALLAGGDAYELIGLVLLEAGKHDEALTAFDEFQKHKPNPAIAGYHRARVEVARGKPVEALEALSAYFDAREISKGVAPYELLSKILADLGRSDELIDRLEKLRQQHRDNVPLTFFLAERHRQAGRPETARPLYEAILAQQPAAEAYRALLELLYASNEPAALLKLLGEVVSKGGSLAVLDESTAPLLADGPFLDTVFKVARRQHAKAEAEDYPALRAAALLAAEGKRWPQAEEFFELAIKAQPKDRAELLLAWGLQLLIEGKHEEAAAVFQRGIDSRALPDDNPAFHFYLAGALAMQDKHDEALAAAQAAAEKRPGNPRFESRLAWILYHARRYDDARQAYQKLIEKYDNDYSSPEVREVLREARLALSNIEVQQENWLAAEEWLEQVLDEFPDDPSANNDLGYLWADRGVHLQRALRMTRLAVEAEPDNVAYLDSLGWALHRLGKHDEALPPLEKAAESDDPDGVILDHLGDVYQALGRHDDAHNAWKRALEAFHKAEENDKARAVRKKLNRSSRQP